MKRKLLYAALHIAVIAFGIRVYLAFHPWRAFVSHSPVGNHIAFQELDLSYHFRAHDLRASPFHPLVIGDLYWEHRYFSGSLFWSRDGSIAHFAPDKGHVRPGGPAAITEPDENAFAAASIISYSDRSEALACAYDFHERRAIRTGSVGSPLDAAADAEIRRLLESRGGYIQNPLPAPKEL